MTLPNMLPYLTHLEQLLHHPTTRHDPAHVATLLTDDFREFGASGRTYDKGDILTLLASGPADAEPLVTSDYHLTSLSPDAALLTYRAVRGAHATLRSSLWVFRDSRWQILFHQGTLAAKATERS